MNKIIAAVIIIVTVITRKLNLVIAMELVTSNNLIY